MPYFGVTEGSVGERAGERKREKGRLQGKGSIRELYGMGALEAKVRERGLENGE